MNYKVNQYKREPLAIAEYKPLEDKAIKRLSRVFGSQVKSVITKNFIQGILNEWNNINKAIINQSLEETSIRKTSEEIQMQREADLDRFISEELDKQKALKKDSDERKALLLILLWLLTSAIETGIVIDKVWLIKKLQVIKDPNAQLIIDKINVDKVNLTNQKILDYINEYSGKVEEGLNDTTKERIKNSVKKEVLKGGTATEIAKQSTVAVTAINVSRSATIARTEIFNAKAYENRIFLGKWGFSFWIWLCAKPQDWECIINCGAIRPVGSPFPSGHDAPTVHPNCQCFTEGYMPTSAVELAILLEIMLKVGEDWSGE